MMKYSPNIDVILGGHTHVMLPSGHLRTGTLLSHTGHSLSHVGVTEIIFSTEHPVSILSKSTRAVSLNEEIPDDPEVKEIVRRFPEIRFSTSKWASPEKKSRTSP